MSSSLASRGRGVSSRHVRVAIAGSGFAGIGAAIRLKQEGVEDFVILERAKDLGGVWRDNSYPGCACDVQSHLYSFSFAKNAEWSRAYSPQAEIWNYLRDCAARFGILPFIEYEQEVKSAAWDDKAKIWRIETSNGHFTAEIFVAATGGLSEPSIPKLPGIDSFEGASFHSATWRHDVDLAERRVAVVGTGASAIQFVPAIQPKVEKLFLFQRTPPWIIPRNDRAISDRAKAIFRKSKIAQTAIRARIYAVREAFALPFLYPELARLVERLARRHLEESVADPELRAKLTPNYTFGCKRVLISDNYFDAVTKANVDVVTSAIAEVRPRSIITADGVERKIDALIFGTGFQVQEFPVAKRVRGKNGVLLSEAWKPTATAHLGTTVHGFPNLFLLLGPNSALGHSSVIIMIEGHIEHLISAIHYMTSHAVKVVEPHAEAQAKFARDVDRKMLGTVWTSGGCSSWYLDSTGRNSAIWPGFTFSLVRRARRFNPSEYELGR